MKYYFFELKSFTRTLTNTPTGTHVYENENELQSLRVGKRRTKKPKAELIKSMK